MEFLLQVARQLGDVTGVAAECERSYHEMDRALHRVGAVVAERLAPAGDAGVGLELDQQDVVGRASTRSRTARRLSEGEWYLDDDAVDLRDLHDTDPFSRISASSRSACVWSASRLEVKRGSPSGAGPSRWLARRAGTAGGSSSYSGISTSANAK